MTSMKPGVDHHEETPVQHILRAVFFCLFLAAVLTGCATPPPVPEKAQLPEPEPEPEKHIPTVGELAVKAANVTEFTKLVYPEETAGLKTPSDKITITLTPRSPEYARKEARSFYTAYCVATDGQLIAGLPVSRIPENLPAHIKPPYSQKFRKKYDLPASAQWCQAKEDVYFGVEIKDRTEGADGPELNVTVYTESFVEKNRIWTSQKDMILKIEKEIDKDKQEFPYSRGTIDIPTAVLAAKVQRLDAEGHQRLELSIENRGKTIMQIRTNAPGKFVARDGRSYDILWEMNKEGGPINVTASGEGCQLTNNNTLFLVNPGSKCTLSALIRIPGLSQQPPDGMMTLDWGTFDMRRVSSYEDKTSQVVPSSGRRSSS